MADQRQSFRFRLPWLAPQRSGQQTQRPRPTSETPRAPSQPTTSVPSSRPVFRPAGIAPSQAPASQPRPPPKVEAQSSSPSPSRAAAESQKETPSTATAKPQSPSRPTNESEKATSQSASSPTAANAIVKPPSPPHAAEESPKVTQSPSRPTTESSKATSQSASSPPAVNAAVKPPSPPSAAAESPKVTQTATTAKPQSPSRVATQSPKAISQSTSSPAANATVKPPSPSPATTEPSKATSQSTSSPSGETATAKPPSPSRVAAEPQVSTKPASPPQTRTQSITASVLASPSQGDPKSKASDVPPSPSHATSEAQQESGKSSQPQSPASQPAQKTNSEVSSPPSKATQVEPTAGIVSQSPSSPEKSQDKTQAQSSAPQQELKKEATSQLPLQEPEPKVEIASETPKITTSHDVAVAKELKEVSDTMATAGSVSREAAETPVPPQKSNLSSNGRDQKPVSKKESEQPEETKKTVQELPKEEKTNRAAYEEPIQKTEHINPASGPEKDTKDIRSVAFQAPKRQQKRGTSDRKETVATTSYIGKQIKTVSSSHPTDEEAPRQKEIKEDISKLVHKLTTGPQVDGKTISVITLTGENRGASMHLSSEPAKKESSIHIHRGYKTNPDESPETEYTTTDGEVRTRGQRFRDQTKKEAPSPTAYVNSNVQSVNNSIVFNASVTERNPGVRLFFSNHTAEAIKSNGKSESLQTHKAEFNVTPSEKLTHEPTVRRRCLRGLFMEPSDSDPDNPDKPRRHGCRYSCGDKSKDNETGLF